MSESRVRFLDIGAANAHLRARLDAAYARVMDSGQWILGVEVQQFEANFARFCGSGHCVGVANGLDAVYLGLRALGIGPGDEVLVPAHTFIATWLAVTRTGAQPIPVEPREGSFLPSAEDFERHLTSRSRAVIAVHLYGELAFAPELVELCKQHSVPLVEDAAQAHGAAIDGRRAGSFGRVGCFSFYPVKNLGCFGDGGGVTTDDMEVASILRKLRNYGGEGRYSHELEGLNSRLDELQAAFLNVLLPELETRNARRREIAATYSRQLGVLGGVELPRPTSGMAHVWHQFVIRTSRRDDLKKWLSEAGVETLVHYPSAVYRLPPFKAFAPGHFTQSDRLAETVLSLPIGPHLSDDQVGRVCDAVADFFRIKS